MNGENYRLRDHKSEPHEKGAYEAARAIARGQDKPKSKVKLYALMAELNPYEDPKAKIYDIWTLGFMDEMRDRK